MSGQGNSAASMCYSASITTGHGGDAPGDWMARGLHSQRVVNRLGNSRPPPPTCNIPQAGGTKLMMPISNEHDWSGNAANTMAGELTLPQTRGNASMGTAGGVASRSTESSQEHLKDSAAEHVVVSDDNDHVSQQEVSDFSGDEADEGMRGLKAPTSHRRGRKGKEKKKVGRPIAYRGDPNAPELTDQERRRIKRRIANRESARRVRHKRQEELEDMQIKMEQVQAHNCQLQQHAALIREQKDLLSSQLLKAEDKYEKVTMENEQLAIEIQALRQSLQLKMSALEEELDKRASEVDASLTTSTAFGHAAIQSRPLSPYSMAQHATLTGQPLDSKLCPSPNLEWFPSLELDDARALDMVDHFFDEPTGAALYVKREC